MLGSPISMQTQGLQQQHNYQTQQIGSQNVGLTQPMIHRLSHEVDAI
jgi:hypothetical protein